MLHFYCVKMQDVLSFIVAVKVFLMNFPEVKAAEKCKIRLKTKHFKAISVCLLLNGVQTRVLLPKGVCGDLPAVDYYSRDGRYTDQSYRGNPLF